MIRVTFLGTSASRPTVGRNVSSIVLNREGELLMFDCGEGTQRQMMRYGTGFSLDDIFFTHLHADHFLGVIGLLRTMGLQGRQNPMRLWSPPRGASILREAVHLGVERVPFDIAIEELAPADRVRRDDYDVVAFATRHGTGSLGYALLEHERKGRFNPDRARELGVPEGPLFGQLHRGEAVNVDGRIVRPEDVVGAPRPGRSVVYTGDTRPVRETVDIARGADLLIHDATFGEDEAERARTTGHSTAREAASVAQQAGVRRLCLTHISSRYAESPRDLEREAREVFRETVVAWDGYEVEVPYRDDDADA
ncbi:MAG TPA: ribonuclease Z [Longimicrobiales bacterium]|nr:ribonuclease Z [Longimicrobiales bacterium]